MLPDILSRIESIVRDEQLLDDQKINILLKLLALYKKGDWVYPSLIIRKLKITADNAYNVLNKLRKAGILELNYEIYCHTCNKFVGEIYSTLSQVPERCECDTCGAEMNIEDNLIVIYRVIDDGGIRGRV